MNDLANEVVWYETLQTREFSGHMGTTGAHSVLMETPAETLEEEEEEGEGEEEEGERYSSSES
ncbi:hypothetical protein CRUP_026412 [Coryphaenoides rupestris]|nr:hypothetical protein CRUP_026412 [Coryphaenoides rupestris]